MLTSLADKLRLLCEAGAHYVVLFPTDPTVLGFPFFYWFQLALAGLSSLVIAVVYLATRKRAVR